MPDGSEDFLRTNASGTLEVALAHTRAGAEAIRRGGGLFGATQLAAECEALRQWAEQAGCLRPFEAISQLAYTLDPDLDRQVREAAADRFEVLKVLADLPISETAPWQAKAPTLNDLQPRDVFRELLTEKQIEGDELSAVFDELLALKEAKATT